MEDALALHTSLQAVPFISSLTYNCSQSLRQGFHFTLTCTINHAQGASVPQLPAEHLHALFHIPTSLFFDPYEVVQRSLEGYGPILKHDIWGETNLELPLASKDLDERGSYALFGLKGDFIGSFEIPIHARYLKPSEGREKYTNVEVEWPIVFTSGEDISSTSTDWPTTFERMSPVSIHPQTPSFNFKIPIGSSQDLLFVEPITAITILGCFFYVANALWKWSLRPKNAHIKME